MQLQSNTEVSSALSKIFVFRASSYLIYCIIFYNSSNIHGKPMKHKMADKKAQYRAALISWNTGGGCSESSHFQIKLAVSGAILVLHSLFSKF